MPDNGNEWRKFPLHPLVLYLFNRGGSRRAFRPPGAGGDHFHCTVEPSPGHIRCRPYCAISHGCDSPSPFLSVFLFGEHAKWSCDTPPPPPTKGVSQRYLPRNLRDTTCKQGEWVRHAPLRYYLEKVLRDMGGGTSHWAPKRLSRGSALLSRDPQLYSALQSRLTTETVDMISGSS